MAMCMASWEDDENNRIVELAVEYRLDGSKLEIENVTPAAVQFVDAESREPVRRIRVWTETGRRMLLSQYQASVGGDHLRRQVDDQLLAEAS